MQTVILCGGLGTRLREETHIKPKPMVAVGDAPILWHIMNIYAAHGHKDFTLALGYLGHVIKEYFLNHRAMSRDLRVDLGTGAVEHVGESHLDWRLDLVDTGANTLTGGRLHRLGERLRDQGTFMLTYGDGVCDIDIEKLLEFHRSHGKIATVTAVRPPARFGTMAFDGDLVLDFKEKPQTGEGWINGGFFVFEPAFFDYLDGDQTILEREPLERLAGERQLMAYKHEGFWQCMDTLRDVQLLEGLWSEGRAPWKCW